jgi:hypothetical protein
MRDEFVHLVFAVGHREGISAGFKATKSGRDPCIE